MQCPECCTNWYDKEDYKKHLEAHHIDDWKMKELLDRWDLMLKPVGKHRPDEACTCRAYWNRYECELRKWRTE